MPIVRTHLDGIDFGKREREKNSGRESFHRNDWICWILLDSYLTTYRDIHSRSNHCAFAFRNYFFVVELFLCSYWIRVQEPFQQGIFRSTAFHILGFILATPLNVNEKTYLLPNTLFRCKYFLKKPKSKNIS
jgi:hypothetical protein